MHSISIDDTAAATPGSDASAPRYWRRIALGGFLAVSALGHGLLLLMPMQVPQRPDASAERGALQVRMQAPAPETVGAAPPKTKPQPTPVESQPRPPAEPVAAPLPKPPPQPAIEPEQQAAKPLPSKPLTSARAPSKPEPKSEPEPHARPVPAASPPAGRSAAEARTAQQAAPNGADAAASTAAAETPVAQRLRTQLEALLRSHFYYPRIARYRGWEGQVEVGLRVEANGRLSDIRILRTSGFALLDRAALASIGRISRLQGAAEWLGGHHIDMVLPVQYRLIDG